MLNAVLAIHAPGIVWFLDITLERSVEEPDVRPSLSEAQGQRKDY